MNGAAPPEVWLRGPVPGISPLLQPVAHALLQAVEDVRRTVDPLAAAQLWARPGLQPRLSAGEIWLLVLYTKSAAGNIPAHVLRQIKEEIEHG